MTDSFSLAAGGYFRGYFNFSFDHPTWSCLHINHKETLGIILAAKRWGHLWANHRVIIYSDNQAAVQINNKGTTNNEIVMQELRVLFWLSAPHNFHITATYLEGFCNTIADSVSHLHEHPHPFYSVLKGRLGCAAAANLALNDHMQPHGRSSLFYGCS